MLETSFVACDTIDTIGTSYQGVVNTTYDDIVAKFGEPTYTDASPYEKVNAQWSIQFDVPTEDGEDYDYVTATIYNWKMGYIPTDKYEWHIGGFDFEAVDLVQKVLDN
tara:strand:- start:769 stop:1092 length:324 start_codon:yes stop_codon:yes gene_type:complete